MIEYIKFKCSGGFDWFDFEFVLNKKRYNYCYTSRDHNNGSGIIKDINSFSDKIEKLKIYSICNEYFFDYMIEDGLDFILHYKETGKDEKVITGQYYPDEIYALLSEIELLIPESKFFIEFDFNEWLDETIEEIELKNVDEKLIARIKADFDAAPTWAIKHKIVEHGFDELIQFAE